jgi:amidohydrolase
MIKEIKALTAEIIPKIIEIRRHLHMHPELSFQEKQTSAYLSQVLSNWDIEHTRGWAEHGISGLIGDTDVQSPTIGLRADIDALPIQETNTAEYTSRNPGIMHACGHDVHSASLLGAVWVLRQLESKLNGKVKFLFQPGEEKIPGGASIMIKEGIMDKPKINYMFGQHVHPPLETGKVGFRPGKYMASADEIYIRVLGKGGHAAIPQDVIDPVVMASQIIIQLQQIVSRMSDPIIPSVLSFGKFNTVGGATNVIPYEVKIEGTFRTMDEDWRRNAHKKMKKMAEDIASSMGGSCEFEIRKGYPFLFNNELLTEQSMQFARQYLGDENVVLLPPRMSAEDFAYYSQIAPACFYRLGTGNVEKGIISGVHTSTFDIDEKALEVGVGLMAYLAMEKLNNI